MLDDSTHHDHEHARARNFHNKTVIAAANCCGSAQEKRSPFRRSQPGAKRKIVMMTSRTKKQKPSVGGITYRSHVKPQSEKPIDAWNGAAAY